MVPPGHTYEHATTAAMRVQAHNATRGSSVFGFLGSGVVRTIRIRTACARCRRKCTRVCPAPHGTVSHLHAASAMASLIGIRHNAKGRAQH